jgi:hypothetical protein
VTSARTRDAAGDNLVLLTDNRLPLACANSAAQTTATVGASALRMFHHNHHGGVHNSARANVRGILPTRLFLEVGSPRVRGVEHLLSLHNVELRGSEVSYDFGNVLG